MIQKALVYIGTMYCQFLRTVVIRKWNEMKKHLQKVFTNNGLDVIIECNIKVVNYLDVTFNLNDVTYQPYQKPDNIIQYIHVESNHSSTIIKQIPKTIESVSPISPPMKKYSMNQNPFMKTNYTSLSTN